METGGRGFVQIGVTVGGELENTRRGWRKNVVPG